VIIKTIRIEKLSWGITDDHPHFKRQPTTFRAARYRSAVCP